MACNCIEIIDESLDEHRLHVSFVYSPAKGTIDSRTYCPLERRDNHQIERRRTKPTIFAHTFCPFCGIRHEPETSGAQLAEGVERTVIVYGPPACGKTRDALKLAHHFGLDLIVDDWDPNRHELQPGALHLTNQCPEVVEAEAYRFDGLRFGGATSSTARRVGPVFIDRFSRRRRDGGAK